MYDLGSQVTDKFDLCISVFVLEHLTNPSKALDEMTKVLNPGGSIILVFPDFKEYGLMPSQAVGFLQGWSSKQKLKKGKIVDAFIAFFEGRILRWNLHNVRSRFGRFVVNLSPACLWQSFGSMIPDYDAVYVGYKEDIVEWAEERGYKVKFPKGKNGLYNQIAFIVLQQ